MQSVLININKRAIVYVVIKMEHQPFYNATWSLFMLWMHLKIVIFVSIQSAGLVHKHYISM